MGEVNQKRLLQRRLLSSPRGWYEEEDGQGLREGTLRQGKLREAPATVQPEGLGPGEVTDRPTSRP